MRPSISHRPYRFYTWSANADIPEITHLAQTIEDWWLADQPARVVANQRLPDDCQAMPEQPYLLAVINRREETGPALAPGRY